MKKRRRWPIFAVLVLGIGGIAYASLRSEAKGKRIDDELTLTAKRGELVIEVVETGKVEPQEKVEIKSKVAGQAQEVHVEEGDRVKEGDLLLTLEPRDYEREVARAQADVEQAEAALEFARLNLERKRQAAKDRAVAKIDVDLAKNEVKTKVIGLKSARIALATARDRLRYTRITSPIAGTVLDVAIQRGEVISPGVQQTFEGRPLMTIGDLSVLLVRAELNQIDIAKVATGQEVKLSFDALPGREFTAEVTKTAPASIKPKDKTVEVFPVEARLVDADAAIRPGMTADVRFQIEVKPDVFAVPIEAVVKEKGKSYVTKLEVVEGEDKPERLEVSVGARNDRQVEITSGLEGGERLLIDPKSAKENEVEL